MLLRRQKLLTESLLIPLILSVILLWMKFVLQNLLDSRTSDIRLDHQTHI